VHCVLHEKPHYSFVVEDTSVYDAVVGQMNVGSVVAQWLRQTVPG